MAAKLIQPTFAGGELDPALWGRVDLDRRGIGARTLKNWIVRAYGGLQSRPGTQYVREVKASANATRVIPFIVSESLAYVVELGNLYARFHYNGATLMDGLSPYEIATPWTSAEVFGLRFTQSADTMILVHPSHAPRKLVRTTSTTFSLSTLTFKEGPFRSLNDDEAHQVWASGTTGEVTVYANKDTFTADMVGTLLYVESKTLGQVKPWVQGERTPDLATGVFRLSDGKVYYASNVPTPPSGAGNFTETGSVRPTHEVGKEWDGPGDTRTVSGVSWKHGVEWEYRHSGYGIIEITSYVNARQVVGTVRRSLPSEVSGGAGTPTNTWNFTGDGITTQFSVAGATQTSNSQYVVTLGGTATQPDPNYYGGGFGNDFDVEQF